MKRLAILAVMAVLWLGPGRAIGDDGQKADARGMAGDWEATLKVTPEVSLRITLKVAKAKDGALSGTWGSPDEGLEGLPLGSIALTDDVLTFATKHGVTYQGKRKVDGTEVAGEWTQRGRKYPLTFRRYDPSRRPAAAMIPAALEGYWEGGLKVGAGIELRLVLKVEKKDGNLKAALASPDQGANNIPINAIELKDDALTFESKLIGAKYSGKKMKEGQGFEGQFTQRGLKFPLVLKKTDRFSASPRPQTPKPPFPYRSEEVAYENRAGGVHLAGTLTLPDGPGPFPVALMITGSGPQDRDETILGHKPFLVIADALTRRGIAVLRVDDRGVGGSSGSGTSSTTEDFSGDALAGVAYLKGRKEIDPGRIGLIGHSEGGLIAPMAASRSADVAFIVLMAGTGRPGDEILVAQGQLIWKAEGLSDADLKVARDVQRRIIDIFRGEKDEAKARAKLAAASKETLASLPDSSRKELAEAGDLSEGMIDQFNNAWFRAFLDYDPRPTLRKVRCPVLAINGEKDLQVPSKDNLAEIRKALEAGGNRDVRTIEFAGLNHLFQPCKTGLPSEYTKIETTIAPEVMQAIGDWIVEKAGPGKIRP